MTAPYPGYPPNYKIIDVLGGMNRTCLVIEILSLGPMDEIQLALVRDQLEGTLDRLRRSMPAMEKFKAVLPSQFDKQLRDGLRIS